MFTRVIAVSTLVLAGLAGVANAQTNAPMVANQQDVPAMHEHYRGERHQVAITDEYGFKYDAQGNRLDANGYVIPPPQTQPGARVIQNGPRS